MATLVNNLVNYTIQQAEQTAAEVLLENLGIVLLGAEVALPLWPFIVAGDIIYNVVTEVISLFDGGRPKFQDTNALIAAYNQSQYWMLKALASDLQIAANNGAPISDSSPAVQAQFSAWKQGTIESFQTQAGFTAGPQSPGYWQLQELINLSWVWSAGGQGQVLKAVQAMDQFFVGLQQLFQQNNTTPPPVPPPPNGTPPPPQPSPDNCDSANQDQDEISDMCHNMSFQLSEIYDQLINGFTGVAGQNNDTCCTNVIAAIAKITTQLGIIAQALAFPKTTNNLIDLTPVVTALNELIVAINAYPPTAEAIATLLRNGLDNIVNAITNSGGADLSIIDKFVEWVQSEFQMKPGELNSWVSAGLVGSDTAQLYSGTIRPPIHNAELLKNLKIFFGDISLFGDWVDTHVKAWLEHTLPKWLDWCVSFLLKLIKQGMSSGMLSDPEWRQLGVDSLGIFQTLFAPFGSFALNTLKQGTSPVGDIDPSQAEANFGVMIGNASALGAAAFGAATIGGMILGEHSKHLNYFAALFALGAGYDEIAKGLVSAMVDPLITTPAKYYYRGQYKAEYPNESYAVQWHSRRLDKTWTLEEIFKYSGLKTKFEDAYIQSAYRPVSPFMLAGGFIDKEVDETILTDAFQFMGLRDKDITLAINTIKVRALQAVNQALVNEAVTAYADGVVSDQELSQSLTDAGYGSTAASLVTKRALLARRIKLASQTEAFIVPEVTAGLLTPDEGLNALEASGIQPWEANLKITLASTRAALNRNKKELAAEAKLANQRTRATARTAISEFRVGNINAVELEAALIAAGQDALISTMTVATETAIQQGRLTFVYGQLLQPEQAKILNDQVAALESQYKKQLITDATVYAQLKSLKVPDTEASNLISRWAALKVAVPKYGELISIK